MPLQGGANAGDKMMTLVAFGWIRDLGLTTPMSLRSESHRPVTLGGTR